jgi:hypothetical protein
MATGVPFPMRREDVMKLNLKNWVLAAVMSIGIGGIALHADDAKDYSKTKQYQQGVREGQSDHAHNLDHSKKRHFKKDEDQRAYESGYQKGFVVAVKIP